MSNDWPAGDPTHPYLWEGRNTLRVKIYHPTHPDRRVFLDRETNMGSKTETEYQGFIIRQVEYVPTPDRVESHGMKVDTAYRVLDDITEEPALPFLQQWYWSVAEAVSAINLFQYLKKNAKRVGWPSTSIHEYNQALRYRWRWGACYVALLKIEEALREGDSLGEDPLEAIAKIMADMKAEVLSS